MTTEAVGGGSYGLPMLLPHPWRRLRHLAHITLVRHEGGPMGKCSHSRQEVSLRSDLNQAQRRAALLHELEHLSAGPAVVGYVDKDELATRDRASRWLIPLDNLAESMVWAADEYELAEELWTDVETVRSRLRGLTDDETALLNDRLDAAERAFPGGSG